MSLSNLVSLNNFTSPVMNNLLVALLLAATFALILGALRWWRWRGGQSKFNLSACPTISVPEGWRVGPGEDSSWILLVGGRDDMAPIVMVRMVRHENAVSAEEFLEELMVTASKTGEGDPLVQETFELQSGVRGLQVRRKVQFENPSMERAEGLGVIPTGFPRQFIWIHANSSVGEWEQTELAFESVLHSVRLDGGLYPRAPREYCLLQPEKVFVNGFIEGQQLHVFDFFERFLEREGADLSRQHEVVGVEKLVSEGPDSLAEIYRLRRFDIVLLDGVQEGDSPSAHEIALWDSRLQSFEPVLFHFQEELEVEVSPFIWGALEIAIEGEVENWLLFENWAEKWLDLEDEKKLGLGGLDLAGVLHRVHPPERREDSWWLTIDCGSIGSDAFWELLTVFSDMGIHRLRVGSWTTAAKPGPASHPIPS
jgi:hypothetical protein